MAQWLKDRLKIIKLALPHPALLALLGLLQAARIFLGLFPPSGPGPLLEAFRMTPWYGWAMAWLALLWFTTVEYSVQRKKSFDETSENFFKGFLDYLIKEGHQLYGRSGEKDFYLMVSNWQRMTIEGIAIGLGHEEAERYFQKMDSQYPLAQAYRESQDSRGVEPLCRALQGNLEELEGIRLGLPEGSRDGNKELVAAKKADLADKSNRPQLPSK